MKTFSPPRAASLILTLSLILPLAATVPAQNLSGSQSSTTTTTTVQTTQPAGATTNEVGDRAFGWFWLIMLGLLVIVATAYYLTRRRAANGERI